MMMKKFVAIFVAVLLVVSALSGCGQRTEEPQTTEPNTSPQAADASARPKIGVVFYSINDDLGKGVYALINNAAEVMGVDVVWQTDAVDIETQITQMENLIAAGCDGLLVIPYDAKVQEKALSLADENDIDVAFCFRELATDLRDQILANPHFIGNCYEDEYGAGVKLVEALKNAGVTDLGCVYMTLGDPMYKSRHDGVEDGIAQTGINKVGEYTREGMEVEKDLASFQNLVNSYPELNGIIAVNGTSGTGESEYSYLQQVVGRDIKYAVFDIIDGATDALADGSIVGVTGGTAPDGLYTFIMLANAVKGTPLSDTPCELQQPYLIVTNASEAEILENTIADPDKIVEVFNADFVRSLDKQSNPDATMEDLIEAQSAYSIDWISEQFK